MLIQFEVKNFRSIKEKQTFSMVAGPYADHTDSNLFSAGVHSFDLPLLRSAAIYGPNAAGKTNLLRALQFMQTFVLNSALAVTTMPYDPFRFSAKTRHEPSEFVVSFINNGQRYEYGFTLTSERIESEWLLEFVTARARSIFSRKYNHKKKEYEWKYSPYLKGNRAVWSESTRPQALFLSTAIQLNSLQLAPVFEWFQRRLVVVADHTKLNSFLTLKLLDDDSGKKQLLSFMQQADFGITDLKVKREPIGPGPAVFYGRPQIIEPGQPVPHLVKITLSHVSDDVNHSYLELQEESNGTQIFFSNAGAIINVLKEAQILLVDELESSLHSHLVRFLIQRFNSNEYNAKNAQLIFTTQSPGLLDRTIFRPDQIWFVENRKDNGSEIYPLSDFKVRKEEPLERNYLEGQYGAIPILSEIQD